MAVEPFRSNRSLVDFNVNKPEFVGRPVDQISQMVQQQDLNNRQIVDEASALDMALANVDINQQDVAGQELLAQQQEAFKSGINDNVSSFISSTVMFNN